MAMSDVLYGMYERRLQKRLVPSQLPKHVGAIVDGNRRWAKGARTGVDNGYQAGADKIGEFLTAPVTDADIDSHPFDIRGGRRRFA